MSITFYPCRLGANGAWAPVTDDQLAEFANANAADVLDELGFGSERIWDAEPIAIGLFAAACQQAIVGFGDRPTPPAGPRLEREGRGVTLVGCGRPEGYLNDRLEELLRMTVAGRAAGATHVLWGHPHTEDLQALPMGKVYPRDERVLPGKKGEAMTRTANGWVVGSWAMVRAKAFQDDAARLTRLPRNAGAQRNAGAPADTPRLSPVDPRQG